MADSQQDYQTVETPNATAATPTTDLVVNQIDIDTETTVNPTTTNKPRPSDAPKQHGHHAKTASVQMMQNHTVEENLLEELCFGKFIVEWPFVLCLIIVFILVIIIFIDGAYFELSEQSNRTFLVEGDKYVNAFDAYSLAGQFMADNTGDDDSITLPQTQTDDFWLYQYMFVLSDYANDFDANKPEKTDYWILTPDNIETIVKYENMIVDDMEWRNKYCYVGTDPLNTNYSCTPAIQSVARLIYDSPDYGNMTTEDIKDFISDNIDSLSFFFNPGVAETGQSFIYRSFFSAGLPIATDTQTVNGNTVHTTEYRNALDSAEEQQTEYISWASLLFKDITVKHNGDLTEGNLKILTVSWIVYDDYFNVLLNESMVYLVFSVIIVLVYMSIHLSSIFLAVCALFQILMSFPLAYFFYRLVYDIPHYDTLSSLIIFVLLGVGADDVFVFTDAWLQSIHFVGAHKRLSTIYEPNCKEKHCCHCCSDENTKQIMVLRMSFTFRRAAKAMLVTQVTTFFAFLATASSVVMPIAAFGLWAATVVAANYVLVISMYPAVLIIHHKFFKKCESKCLCCACNLCKQFLCAKKEEINVGNDNDNGNGNGDDDMMPEISRQLSDTNDNSLDNTSEEYRCFEQFLGRKWSKCIIKFRYITLGIFAVIFIIAAILGSQMEAQSEDEKWFSDAHFMQKAQDRAKEFSASETDNLVQILITFGIDGVDRAGSSRWDPESYGSVVWDDTFDMSSSDAQLYLVHICEQTRNSSLVYPTELLTSRNTSVVCPIEDFQFYLQSLGIDFPYVTHTNSGMKSFGEMYLDFVNSDYGFEAKSAALSFVDTNNANKLRFYAMEIYTTITWTAASDISREERGKWDAFIDEFSDDCPQFLCDSVANVALRWCWLVTQSAFVRSAIQGIFIAMPLAFIILLLSTQNWIISIFAVIDIIGIMLCELSIMFLMGWKFGVSECVAIVIIIGFSVDYVVHLANAYLESSQNGRNERLSFALLTMGISVVSGAITTFAAGFFLVFPPIVFFYKMGILMVSTVAISIIWAMCFFTSICAAFGPQGNSGDLKQYFKCCVCGKSKKEKKTEEKSNNGNGVKRTDTYQNYEIGEGELKGYEIEMETNPTQIR